MVSMTSGFKGIATLFLALELLWALPQVVLVKAIATSDNINNTDSSWYVGKGAKENTYLKYQIHFFKINNGQPFNMTIYFSQYNITGQYWVAKIFVQNKNNLDKIYSVNGTFHLTDTNLNILNDSVSNSFRNKDMKIYENAYLSSLLWLARYTSKDNPQSLYTNNWFVPSSPDDAGGIVSNLGNDTITIPAGTFDTTVRGIFSNSTHVKMWINKDIPYALKGEMADRLPGNSSFSFYSSFELLEVNSGYPPIAIVPEFPVGSSMSVALPLAIITMICIISPTTKKPISTFS
jgi:hypothetical protein